MSNQDVLKSQIGNILDKYVLAYNLDELKFRESGQATVTRELEELVSAQVAREVFLIEKERV